MKLLICILSMLCAAPAYANVVELLDSLFAQRYGSCVNEPGAAVIIAHGDDIVYERYFGIADMVTGQPIGRVTRFNIASVSKQFTVVSLLQTGVDIDRPVSDFFAYPQSFWHDVTLRHLCSHTSGVPDSRDRSDRQLCVYADDYISAMYFPTVEALKFTPGSAYDYLNPSFILLARVIEQVSGKDFVTYQHDNIFAPCGMASTYYFDPYTTDSYAAHGYVTDGDGLWCEYDYGEETFFGTRPDGGIYSTARDMLRWERALASGKVLNPKARDEAYTPQIQVSGSPWCDYQNRPDTFYGLGWFVDKSATYTKVYHTGDNGGFQAYVAKYPDLDLCIIVLENRNDRDRWQMAKQIDDILLSR